MPQIRIPMSLLPRQCKLDQVHIIHGCLLRSVDCQKLREIRDLRGTPVGDALEEIADFWVSAENRGAYRHRAEYSKVRTSSCSRYTRHAALCCLPWSLCRRICEAHVHFRRCQEISRATLDPFYPEVVTNSEPRLCGTVLFFRRCPFSSGRRTSSRITSSL